MNKIALIFCACFSTLTYANETTLFNTAYVEVNDHQLSNTACFVRADTGKPLFDMVSIFAANINGDEPNKPVIYFNPQVNALLNQTNDVAKLQGQGIKVLLTLLGNHQNAGWACMTDQHAIELFADDIVKTVNKYKLDGIDIDDEYSRCAVNKTSLIRITQAIKNHPGFKGKILSKALFADSAYFAANYEGHKLAEFLDYGWEMSYFSSGYDYRLNPYLGYGMTKQNLALGVSTGMAGPTNSANYVVKNGFGGMMVFNLAKNSEAYLTQMTKAEYGVDVAVIPNCLA